MSESIIHSLSANVLRLGNECRDLANENARLKAEVERLTEAWVDKKMQEDRDTLLRQNERLRKAGDVMAFNYKQMSDFNGIYDTDFMKYVDCWNAAKEGKPSV